MVEELVDRVKLFLLWKMEGYKPPHGRVGFQHYGQKLFKNRKIRSRGYFSLLEARSIAGGEVAFVVNRFKTIPTSVENFPKSIRFKFFWRTTVRGRWKEVSLKPQFLDELSEVVDVDEVVWALEKASFGYL